MMADDKQFHMIVEEAPQFDLTIAGEAPHLIVDKDGVYYVRTGQIVFQENMYKYVRAVPHYINSGKERFR